MQKTAVCKLFGGHEALFHCRKKMAPLGAIFYTNEVSLFRCRVVQCFRVIPFLDDLRNYLVQVAYDRVIAISMIGASASLLIATMQSEFCIPARCWIAPEIPHAK